MPCHRTDRKKVKGPYAPKPLAVDGATDKLERHKFASVMAQIGLASCFRNEHEPLFGILSTFLSRWYACLGNNGIAGEGFPRALLTGDFQTSGCPAKIRRRIVILSLS